MHSEMPSKKAKPSSSSHHESKHSEDKELARLRHALEISEESRTRLAADYANLERRISEEREKVTQRASTQWLKKLFPILDNFYRASTHAPTISLDDDRTTLSEEAFQKIHSYFVGLRQIEKQLEEVLLEAGLKRISTKGNMFDPNLHEAISYEPSNDVPADHIIDEVEAGWQLKDDVIRPAKVRVSQG